MSPKREPAWWTALIRQGLIVGSLFGLDLDAQTITAVSVVSEVVLTPILRSKVSPVP